VVQPSIFYRRMRREQVCGRKGAIFTILLGLM
jgi:hypothetical protein